MDSNQKIVVEGLQFSLALPVPEFSGSIWQCPYVNFPKWLPFECTHVVSPYTVDNKVAELKPHVANIHYPRDRFVFNCLLKVLFKAHTALVGTIQVVVNYKLIRRRMTLLCHLIKLLFNRYLKLL